MEARKLLRKMRDWILWQKFFFNRGDNMMSDIVKLLTLTTIVGLFVEKINTYFHANLSVSKAMMFIPLIVVIEWIMGKLDFHKIHIIQKEGEIANISNPSLYDKLCRVDQSVKEIKEEIKKVGGYKNNKST